MLAFLLGLFRLVFLFGKDHRAVVLENLALRQQLSIYKRKHKRPRLVEGDRWFWIGLSVVWKDWRRALMVVHSRHGSTLAARTFPPLLDAVVEDVEKSRPALDRPTDQRVDSSDGPGERHLARAADSWGTAETGNRDFGAHRVACPVNGQTTAVANLGNLPAESSRRNRCD